MGINPQVETREIAEDELDLVAGGIGNGDLSLGGVNLQPMTEVSHLADVAAPITGIVGGITGNL